MVLALGWTCARGQTHLIYCCKLRRIIAGRKGLRADPICGRGGPAGNVRGFIRKWRAMRNEDANRFEIQIVT